MGRSGTYHVVGESARIEKPNGVTVRCQYPAMNRVEMEQQRVNARKDGHPITSWYSQTKTGERILGDPFGWVTDAKAPRVKLITCPVCQGEGSNGKFHCPVCNGSGICKPGNERRWTAWQLEDMRARHN